MKTISMLRIASGVTLCTCLALALPLPAAAQDSNSARFAPADLVLSANSTLQNFLRDPDMSWLQQNIGRAKGVLIAPEVVKAGFIFGGSGGRALLVVKDRDGRWMGPAFYTLATGSVGFQAGVSVSEVAMLVMTESGVNALMATSFRLGGDASIAAGPVGAGAKSDLIADFVTFSRSKGIYGGVNLDGTVVTSNDEWNRAYYGKQGLLPPDILIRGTVTAADAAPLIETLAKATQKR
jgi:lipid-binding SYLF domain-containing protein